VCLSCALDFQLAFEAASALREDVEYQAAAVEHPPLGELLEVAFLARGECVIDEDEVGLMGLGDAAQLLGFAAAEKVA